MDINTRQMLLEALKSFDDTKYINAEDIPDIPLYMDQVTTFMDEMLSSGKRYEGDKILTKTMINNYSKNNLLPPSVKKKYSKEHIVVMTLIYYLKSFLSIKDIETLLVPITDKYFKSEGDLNIVSIYEEIKEAERSRIHDVTKDIVSSYQDASHSFESADEEDKEYLQLFTFLCHLSFDVYMKKMLMQRLIDDIARSSEEEKKYSKKNTDKKKLY